MFVLFTLIPYIVFFALMAAIINKARTDSLNSSARRKTSSSYKNSTGQRPTKPRIAEDDSIRDSNRTSMGSDERVRKSSNKSPSRPDNGVTHMMNKSVESNLRDDRNNDWLAKQLREEKRSLGLMREMFDLKAEHANNCEAEMLKRFHEENHGKE